MSYGYRCLVCVGQLAQCLAHNKRLLCGSYTSVAAFCTFNAGLFLYAQGNIQGAKITQPSRRRPCNGTWNPGFLFLLGARPAATLEELT